MALINILAKSNGYLNWNEFAYEYSKLHLSTVEVFPIPKELGFDKDSIGIAVHNGYPDKKQVLQELKLLVSFFMKNKLEMTELYNGVEISSYNVVSVLGGLLP